MRNPRYANGFELTLHPDQLELPLKWKRPRRVFVNSMSDLFHARVPDTFIEAVFTTMLRARWHTFQVLTKRAERLPIIAPKLTWPENVWMGVSVENADYVGRIDNLRRVPAAIRFLSIEPLLGPLPSLNLSGISWVIVGGESGPGYRAPNVDWIRSVRDQCARAGVPFFFKQWGGSLSKSGGRTLDGRTWDQMPDERVHHLHRRIC
jgi:protein gp37